MRRFEITIHEVDEAGKPMAESEALRMMVCGLRGDELIPGQMLDQLEQEITTEGIKVLRQWLTWRIEQLDAELAGERQHKTTDCHVTFDGKKELTVASVVGRIYPRRQVCACSTCSQDFMPVNQLLPEHHNIVITRGLQELTCLFALQPSYGRAHDYVIRMTQDPTVLSEREVQEIILTHGQAIRQLEDAQAESVLHKDEVEGEPVLVASQAPRRRSDWTEQVGREVETALHTGVLDKAPEGVSDRDWERIVAQTQDQQDENHTLKSLACLGPRLRPNEMLVALDGIVVRGRRKNSRIELRVGRVATVTGYRYISGTGDVFLTRVLAAIKALSGKGRFLIMLGDGASWIRTFFEEHLAAYPDKELILDWYHLAKKCRKMLSMIGHTQQQRRELLQQLTRLLWEGQTAAGIAFLETLRETARRLDILEELIGYLHKHRPYIPNYRQRRTECRFNSSNAAERACNILVARRQKHKSMHWIEKGADALCALQTLWHNLAWDLYWNAGQILPLLTSHHPSALAC